MTSGWTRISGCLVVLAGSVPAAAEMHWALQQVDGFGVGTWPDTHSPPVTFTGILLNNPEEMLDPTPNFIPYDPGNPFPVRLGGQWQAFIQPTDPADHAGTACWMGQNYGNLPFKRDSSLSYTDSQWAAEMDRVNYDGGHHFRKGDEVQVTANIVGFYGGKTNVNEAHMTQAFADFSISLVAAGHGLPDPEPLTLTDLYADPNSAGYDAAWPLFDPSRQTGAEYYQARRVRIDGLILADDSGWGQEAWADRVCTVAGIDVTHFKLRMPRGSVVGLGNAPSGEFDAIGILNQESESGMDGRYGYELFVTEVVPEPTCLALLGLGLGGLALRARRRRR